MADVGPPLVLISLGLVLWLAVNATLAGISVQTIGLSSSWPVSSGSSSRWSRAPIGRRRATVVRDEPVVRERELY